MLLFKILPSICLLLIITKPLPYNLSKQLEKWYSPFDNNKLAAENSVNIIVLGGGNTNHQHWPSNQKLSLVAMGRLAEGIRIAQLHPKSKLIFSGGLKTTAILKS